MCNLYGERAQNVNTSIPVFNAVCDGKKRQLILKAIALFYCRSIKPMTGLSKPVTRTCKEKRQLPAKTG